jgi:AraC-like DNA-binding protein
MSDGLLASAVGEAPASQWELRRRAPHTAIAPGLLRGYEGYADNRMRSADRHLPIAHIPVIIGFGAPMRIRGDGDSRSGGESHTAFVAGLYESPTVGETEGAGMGVQVDFMPLAAHALFGIPMHQLANRVVELDDIFGRDARDLVERLRAAPTWARRFDLIDAFLLPRLATACVSAEVSWAWARLAGAGGNASIGSLAAAIGWSRRHLVEKFREQAGLPPKAIARIMRFNRALSLLRSETAPRWTDVAYAAGYFDQAHMIRDFRTFAGATPTQLARTLDADSGTSIAAV